MPPDDAYWWTRVLCEMTRPAREKDPDVLFANNPVIKFLTVLLLALVAAPAFAQTGPCPTGATLSVIPVGSVINVCVAPNTSSQAGHTAVDVATGQPVVSSYDVILLNATDPVTGPAQATINVGKPALNSSGVFWAVLPNASVPTGRQFRGTAVAEGQMDGTTRLVSGRSPLSNPFVVANPTAPGAPSALAVP